jgi:site-specific recombinase XerD
MEATMTSTTLEVLNRRESLSLEHIAEAWLRSGLSPTTQDAYRSEVRRYGRWLAERGTHPFTASRQDLDEYREWLTDKSLSPSSVRRALAAVSAFYSFALSEEAIERNPAANVKRPKGGGRKGRALSYPELLRLLDAAEAKSPRDHLLVCLLGLNGLRVSEALSLNVEDVGEDSGYRVIRFAEKGGDEMVRALNPRTARAIYSLRNNRPPRDCADDSQAGGAPLFVTSGDKRLDRFAAYKTIRRLGMATGLGELHPHVLRATYATLAQLRGADVIQLQRSMGHASVRTTQSYLHRQADLAEDPTFLL